MRDFKWYVYAFEEKYSETKAEEDKKPAETAWKYYLIIEEGFAKQGLGSYVYGEPLTLDNKTLRMICSPDAKKIK